MNDAETAHEDHLIETGSYGPALTAAGDWCAPSETLYDPASLDTKVYDVITLPDFSVHRGGIAYSVLSDPELAGARTRADAERTAAGNLRRHIRRHVGDTSLAQHNAIHTAVTEAVRHGWTVELHTRTHQRFVGIALVPLRRGRGTTIHEAWYETEDAWGSRILDADDWCEMFES